MQKKSKLKFVGNSLLLLIIIAIIIYVLKNSLHDIIWQLRQTDIEILIGVVILGMAYQMIEGVNIARITQFFQKSFTWKDGFFCAAYVVFYRVISFGSGTSVSEIVYYHKKGVQTSEGIGIAAMHLINYKIAVMLFAIIGLVFQLPELYHHAPKMIPFILLGVAVTFVVVFAIIFLSSNQKVHVWLIEKVKKHLKKEKWLKRLEKVNEQIFSLRRAIKSITEDHLGIVKLLAINVVKLVFWYSIPFFVLRDSHDFSFFLIFSLMSFTTVLSGVIPAPAGIGSFEFVYMFLFHPLVGTVDAAASMLLYRFASYMLPFLIGMIYVLVTKRRQMREEFELIKEENTKE